MEKDVVIRFLAEINHSSVNTLISIMENKLNSGINKFKLLISSPGGTVFHGISAFNFLKGTQAEITTQNFGSVDSIATVIYCAGSKRISVPNARFLIHSIGWNSPNIRLEEKHLQEQLKSLTIDRENIAKIIADNCKKTQKEVENMMLKGVTLSPSEAKKFGLVHEINQVILPQNAEIIGIG